MDDGDDLIEEYSGFGVRFETRKLGTERLGVFFEWSTFDQTWRDADAGGASRSIQVRASLSQPHDGGAAREVRDHPAAHLGGGVSITELDALAESVVRTRRWRTPRSDR